MKVNSATSRILFIVIALFLSSLIAGCAGMESAPKKGIWFYHRELPDAERAVQDAVKTGRDKECPQAFNDVKKMKDNAYETYWSCRTEEAICMARNATNAAKALCPSKHKPLPVKEKCAAPKVIDRMTLMVNFDFDKSKIREVDKAELKKAIAFVKKYSGAKIKLEGYTDFIGTEKYNMALSERRANAVRDYLVREGGVVKKEIKAVGYGESNPVASNKTAAGRAKNRRVEILILGD